MVGTELQLYGDFSVNRLHGAPQVVFPVGGCVGLRPAVGHIPAYQCYAGQETEVEIVVQTQVANHVDMESGAVIRCHALYGLSQRVVFREAKVKFRLGITHLYTPVQQPVVERPQECSPRLPLHRARQAQHH